LSKLQDKGISLDDLVVPIYIDTNSLLDLLASIEGGFSVVEKVTSKNAGTRTSEIAGKAEGGTEFGIHNVLSLLKINLGGSANLKRGQENSQQLEKERYHTYGSLLYRLRLTLLEGGKLKTFDDSADSWASIQSADFVELRGVFRPNPLADAMRRVDGFLELGQLFADVEPDMLSSSRSGRPTQNLRGKSQQSKQLEGIRKFIQGIVANLEKEDIRLLVIDLNEPPTHKAVISVFTEYLRDPTLTELAHKEFRVLGRVVRKLADNNTQSIDLLQGTSIGGMGDEVIGQLSTAFGSMEGMNLPKVETKISAPVLQLVPVAIYV
jgi:hypothetical protein